MPILGPSNALSPRQWGARVDYDLWRDFYTPDDGVALHHGGGGDYPAGNPPYTQAKEIAQLRAWEAFHIDGRGWRGLAYGWAIGQTGTIYRARGWASYGAHTGDVDGDGIANNSEIIPIIFIGSGHHHLLSSAAREATAQIRRWIEGQAPKATYLYGHQELRGTVTSCPGPIGMTYVRANRKLNSLSIPQEDDDMWQYLNIDESLIRHAHTQGWFKRPDGSPDKTAATLKYWLQHLPEWQKGEPDPGFAQDWLGLRRAISNGIARTGSSVSASDLTEADVQAIVDGHGHKATVKSTIELT